ncbi:MAG: hypothetical protein A3J38_09860 [Gammaproteobacteria bacterium RIFCSPHIGHO2_12_FULL_45_9]|nr:MAG: hypothetical protein A3J38_09860 [Gammaproteobacteria bacterium RIFCSPHIGHO2_12_FULL_45_9]
MQPVVIIGGGVVGLTLALALGRADIPVIVIHREPMPDAAVLTAPWGLRVSAIHETALSALATLGLTTFAKQGVIDQLHIREDDDPDVLWFRAAEVGAPYLGLILENLSLQRQLYEAVLGCSSVQCMEAHPVTLTATESGGLLLLSTGEEIACAVIAGADGAHSWVREQAHFTLQERPYGHFAMVAPIHIEKPHRETAYQIFRPEGPVALLPLSEPHHTSLVWSRALEGGIADSSAEFLQALQAAFGDVLGALKVAGQPEAIALHERHADAYVKPGIVLLGDAAHTIHPLAGQGMNLGIMDALCLASVWKRAFQRQVSLGHISVLKRYERERRFSNTLMLKSMAVFHHVFGSPSPVWGGVRGLAMEMVAQCSPLRQAFTAAGMGRW